VERYRIGDGKAGEDGDLVDDAVGIVRGRADEEDRVWIYEAADFGNGNAIRGSGVWDGVEFDVEKEAAL
jgi:hypothetical protein